MRELVEALDEAIVLLEWYHTELDPDSSPNNCWPSLRAVLAKYEKELST